MEENDIYDQPLFFMTKNFTKARPFGPSSKEQTRIHDLTHQNHILGVQSELFIGIELTMFGSTTHPKLPTTRLHPYRRPTSTNWLKIYNRPRRVGNFKNFLLFLLKGA